MSKHVEYRYIIEVEPGYYYYWADCGRSDRTSSPHLAYSFDSEEAARASLEHHPNGIVRKLEISYRIRKPDWLVISYKPYGVEYSCGQVQRGFSEELVAMRFNDEEKAIDHIVALDKSVNPRDNEDFVHWVLTEEDIFGERDEDRDFYPQFECDTWNNGLPSESHLPVGWYDKIKAKKQS
jgi:hypothetical protein